MLTETGTDISLAAAILRQGSLVAIPTETVYGLAANALNPDAVVKIFEAKERPFFDPLIVHIARPEDSLRYTVHVPETAKRLMEAFWPGPLTLILPKNESIPDIVTSGQPTVGLRVPRHPICLRLLEELEFPLAAPSANPFGYISPTEPAHVARQLGGRIPYILDGGPCRIGIESTIVGFEDELPVVYRLGGISLEDIESVAGYFELRLNTSSDPKAPGQLLSHYAPRKPLFIGDIPSMLERFTNQPVGVISFMDSYFGPNVEMNWVLSQEGDLSEAASNLFRALREADSMEAGIILAEEAPEIGLGRAINDRLRRAAIR